MIGQAKNLLMFEYVSYLLGEVVHKTFRMETFCFS